MKELTQKLYSIIFEADTREGKLFDEILLGTIIFSILLVMLESVPTIRVRYHTLLRSLEWVITAIFTLEYLTRIWVVNRPWKYVFSFMAWWIFLRCYPPIWGYFLQEDTV